jgi:hypothetical protein
MRNHTFTIQNTICKKPHNIFFEKNTYKIVVAAAGKSADHDDKQHHSSIHIKTYILARKISISLLAISSKATYAFYILELLKFLGGFKDSHISLLPLLWSIFQTNKNKKVPSIFDC